MNNKWGDVKFLHYRVYGRGGVQPCGGTTVAYVELDDGTIKWATARCNEKDRYNKAYGRQKSAGRLLSRTLSCVTKLSRKDWVADMDLIASTHPQYRRVNK